MTVPSAPSKPRSVGDRVDDLLQRGRDDVDLLAALVVLPHELERLGVDERPEDRLHRLGDELAELLGRVAGEDLQAVLRSAPHRLVTRAARDEEELPAGRAQHLPARDDPALAERPGEREGR